VSAPALDVVIVAYGPAGPLARCLRSLAENPAEGGMSVTVLDNGGSDGLERVVGESYPEAALVVNERNLGFAAASNIGIRRGGAPFVLLLNPDAAVGPGTLDTLIELIRSNETIGCAGPALHREDGSFDHAARRSIPTPLSALGHFSGIGRRTGGPLGSYRAPEVDRGPVDAVNGAFMLLRREALEQVGLLDEGYWMYMEDLDLCMRLKRAGWTTFYESRARATHSKAGTTGGRRSPRLELAFHRGMGRFWRRHLAGDAPALLSLAVYLGIGLKLTATSVAGLLARRPRSG
jgi:N-acetylglucosaminyl-diphospho-decaprenol L-rhamnosyltransferase